MSSLVNRLISLVPLIHLAAGGLIAMGIGMVVYEHKEEIAEAFEDLKYGIETAIERNRRRKMGVPAYGQNRYTEQRFDDDNDDDLYHTPNASRAEASQPSNHTQEVEESNFTDSDSELWDSTRTLTARDGQTSGVYDRKATFRGRRASRKPQNAPGYALSSDDGPSTTVSSSSSGDETPEDEQQFDYNKYLPKSQIKKLNF